MNKDKKKEVAAVAPAVEEAVDMPITKKELKEFAEELSAKHAETLKTREKKFAVTGSEEDGVKLEKTKKRSNVATFFKSLAGDKIEAKKLHMLRAKTLNEGTGTAGGFLVPEEFERTVRVTADEFSQIRSDATVIPMSAPTLRMNSLTTDVAVQYVGEGVQKPITEPVFGEPVLTLRKIAAVTTWTDELAEDSEVGLVNFLAERFAERIAQLEQNELINGVVAGSEGLLTVAGVTTVTTAGPGFGDLNWDDMKAGITALRALSMQEDRAGKFYMHPSIWEVLCTLREGAGTGTYLGGMPINQITQTAWGKPVVLVNEMPDLAASAALTKFVVYADLSRHLFIGQKGGMRVAVTDQATVNAENLWEEDKSAIRVVSRVGQTTALQNAIIVLETP